MKTSTKTPFDTFIEARKSLSSISGPLYGLGIKLEMNHNQAVNYTLNWEESESISSQVYALGYFDGLTQEEELALALAVKQEEQNDYIDIKDIRAVNDFFGLNISFEMVQELNSKYI